MGLRKAKKFPQLELGNQIGCQAEDLLLQERIVSKSITNNSMEEVKRM